MNSLVFFPFELGRAQAHIASLLAERPVFASAAEEPNRGPAPGSPATAPICCLLRAYRA